MSSAPLSQLTANLICMASMLAWAAGLPMVDLLVAKVTPLDLTALRMALAAAIMLPVWLMLDGTAAMRGAQWGRGIVIGGATFGLGAFLLVEAQRLTDAVTVAVISATMPIVGIAIECLADGRRLTFALILGVVLSLAGGLMAYGAGMGGLTLGWGAVAALICVLAFTTGSRLTVTAFPALSPVGRTALTLTGAALATGVAALIAAGAGAPGSDWAALGRNEILALALYAFASMALSQILWIISVGHLGIGIASLHINAAPFYVMLFLVALGGGWNGWQAIGAAVVAAGVLVAQGLPPRAAAAKS